MDRIKLLIIDDNYRFIKSAVNFLALYEEIEILGGAISYEIAIKMAENMNPDLILLDLSVPDFTGLELLSKLKELMPAVKIIITTIEDSDEYRDRCLQKGADDFVSKSEFGNKIIPSIFNLFDYTAG